MTAAVSLSHHLKQLFNDEDFASVLAVVVVVVVVVPVVVADADVDFSVAIMDPVRFQIIIFPNQTFATVEMELKCVDFRIGRLNLCH